MSARTPQRVSELSGPGRELASLVPGVYLARNELVDGHPLLLLLEVLARPLAELEAAILALHDDHFVERASTDALPLLGDLVGARLLTQDARTTRAVVARTLHWRRRKGNLATLEDVLSLTSGWSTEADEGFRSLLVTQDFAHLTPWRGRDAALLGPDRTRRPAARAGRRRPIVGQPARREDLVGANRTSRWKTRCGASAPPTPVGPQCLPRTVDLLGWAQPDRVASAAAASCRSRSTRSSSRPRT